MPILERDKVANEELSPGTERWTLVDDARGSKSLSVADLSLAPGSKVPTHYHPTEEAMVIIDGELEAEVGNDLLTVHPGQTVLAPAGVKHGFVNRTGKPARLLAVFPTSKVERIYVGQEH